MEKMVKKDVYELVIGVVKGEVEITDEVRDVIVERMTKDIELASKKRTSVNSKKAQEVTERTEAVYNALVELGKPSTATEIGNELGVSNQSASAYLKKLVEAGRVEKETGKVTLFKIAE